MKNLQTGAEIVIINEELNQLLDALENPAFALFTAPVYVGRHRWHVAS